MKRIAYISFILAGLAVMSCSKQAIHPIADSDQEVPVWKSSKNGVDDVINPGGGTGTITDPNNDKDESSRRKN
jgi:hypothetical protein